MEIKLLGTSSAEGWPGLFCECDVCRRSRKIGGKDLRSRASALIDGALKIDLPPDTLHHALTQGLDLTCVKHLLFTHGHDDHCAGYELQYMSWMFVPGPIAEPLHILAPQSTLDKIRAQAGDEELPLTMECIRAWETVPFGPWQIAAIAAHHDPTQVCLNHLITRDGRKLLYATDTGWWDPPTWEFLKSRRLDGVVVECSKGMDEGGYEGHLSVPQVIRMREWMLANGVLRADAPMVTTHHSHLGGMMHADLEAALNPHGIQVGYDGMTFRV